MSKGIRADRITIEMRVSSFWMQVDRREPHECWLWTGYVEKGYGRFFDGERMRPAHEMALTYATGEVRAPDFDTCHSCHVPMCCNPAHLRFDTRASNVTDAMRANRHAVGERNGQSLLTEGDVVTIRIRHAGGATGRSLAREYAVSEGAIQAIVTGRNWKEAGGPIRSQHGNTKHGRYRKHGR